MKKPEITPGEWKKASNSPFVYALNQASKPSNRFHLRVYGGLDDNNNGISPSEENAIAQAIAALPDLLEALECALDRINAANDHQRAAGRLEYGTHDIVAALTKAGYTF